jgi:hypothetical protein
MVNAISVHDSVKCKGKMKGHNGRLIDMCGYEACNIEECKEIIKGQKRKLKQHRRMQ